MTLIQCSLTFLANSIESSKCLLTSSITWRSLSSFSLTFSLSLSSLSLLSLSSLSLSLCSCSRLSLKIQQSASQQISFNCPGLRNVVYFLSGWRILMASNKTSNMSVVSRLCYSVLLLDCVTGLCYCVLLVVTGHSAGRTVL